MTITKVVCDLCFKEINKRKEQSTYDYYLPFTEEKDSPAVTIKPKRHNLCEHCAELIKETCVCIKAEAMANQ